MQRLVLLHTFHPIFLQEEFTQPLRSLQHASMVIAEQVVSTMVILADVGVQHLSSCADAE